MVCSALLPSGQQNPLCPPQQTSLQHGKVTYWVITPEVATDSVVSALRQSWLRGADVRFSVAAGMSTSQDSTLHWLPNLNRSERVANGRSDLNSRLHSTAASPGGNETGPAQQSSMRSEAASVAREATLAHRRRDEADSRELTRLYNNFLRHKVFEMMREMCRARTTADFFFMMDADTAVNRTNLERFVMSIDPSAAVYTGLCKRRNTWGNAQQRGVGGGPGILLSRQLLHATCPQLEQCAPLRTMMDRLQFAGGDLMLAKCMEFLGHRCKMEKEIPYTNAAAAERRDENAKGNTPSVRRLDDLFRRGPPWVYPPLSGGTVLVATRRSVGGKAIEQYERLTTTGLPATAVVSFHRVKPSLRNHDWSKDSRCRVFAEYKRLESGPAHWTSRCLPGFLLLGTPKSGTTSLFNWILQHPDVRPPLRKELHFWAPVLTPEKHCVDRASCATLSQTTNGGGALWPLSKVTAGRLLTAYLELFPRIDPRDFAITGEASPAYLYSLSTALFLENSLMSHMRVLLLLRDPVERTFSEYKNKRDLMVKGAPKATAWINGHAHFRAFVENLEATTRGCTAAELYAACETCQRFTQTDTTHNISHVKRCATPPVVWQSWYHLFVPRFQRHKKRLLVEFSDDMFADADALMRRVGSFIGLANHSFSTSIAYNTESRRGAYINVPGPGDVKTAKSSARNNAASAASAANQRSTAAAQELHVLERLVKDSVAKLQAVLADTRWIAPEQQLRRSLPPKWVERYLSEV